MAYVLYTPTIYYVSSKDPLYVAEYDLIAKAKLVIDSSNRCVWSYYTSAPQGMPTCSSSAIDASVHCFSTAVIDSILQDLTPADRWLQLYLIEHVFGISNATAYHVPSVFLLDPSSPLVSSGPRADVSSRASLLIDRPSRALHSSLTGTSLADELSCAYQTPLTLVQLMTQSSRFIKSHYAD